MKLKRVSIRIEKVYTVTFLDHGDDNKLLAHAHNIPIPDIETNNIGSRTSNLESQQIVSVSLLPSKDN